MCNHKDNAAGMMRRGLVTVGTFSPPSAGGKRLLLFALWVGLGQDGPVQLWESVLYTSVSACSLAKAWKGVSWDINAWEDIEHLCSSARSA